MLTLIYLLPEYLSQAAFADNVHCNTSTAKFLCSLIPCTPFIQHKTFVFNLKKVDVLFSVYGGEHRRLSRREKSLSRREKRENDTTWFLNPRNQEPGTRNQIQGTARTMTNTEPYLSCYISNPKFPVWQEKPIEVIGIQSHSFSRGKH